MKKVFTIFCLLVFAGLGSLKAQQNGPAIVFQNTTYDFGQIMESGGPVTCIFELTNTGNQPLVIQSVNASCGCTTPGYTREPIAPGAKGEVKATYNPLRRPGKFDKNLTVVTNGSPSRIILHIKGDVLTKPADLVALYPSTIGTLRLKSTDAPMGIVSSDASKIVILETANNEAAPISFTFDKTPDYIKVEAEPATLQPRQQGRIKITYDATKKKDFGFSKDLVGVVVGSQKGSIDISAITQEKMKKEAIENVEQPRISIKDSKFNFGSVARGKSVTITYDITNDGKGDLVLHNVTSEKNGVKSSVKNTKIKSGKTATIKFTYTPSEQGQNSFKAYITTNDPANTLVTLNAEGTVS